MRKQKFLKTLIINRRCNLFVLYFQRDILDFFFVKRDVSQHHALPFYLEIN